MDQVQWRIRWGETERIATILRHLGDLAFCDTLINHNWIRTLNVRDCRNLLVEEVFGMIRYSLVQLHSETPIDLSQSIRVTGLIGLSIFSERSDLS